ncbi:cell wall-binding repeat-containing protein [Compostimonas suwonensis]|uniref:Putative cell wall binding repeat protein n=1 Tax=Compostimonas suwonensis TaxID=1048394 RepID=A0A2M9BUW4_9MICO|nr:cell wall-binding repeat-containing protein [Compostimonas suwonensis]PJJ61749.1 putative cell wall binding repeat protein [Compostimonas suwonensis]
MLPLSAARRPILGALGALALVAALALSPTASARADDAPAPDRNANEAAQAQAQAEYQAAQAGVNNTVPPEPESRGVSALAASLSGADFNPGNIISDANFYDGDAMTEAQVQSFLDQKGAGCRSVGGVPCLKDFTQTTKDQIDYPDICSPYAGAANESAARIIVKSAAACGISPRVILTLLQKEQSLVSSPGPDQDQYTHATGYGCPDGSNCDANYYGFYNQVYEAAWQLSDYRTSPTFDYLPVGKASPIDFSPEDSCGSAKVTIWNDATAALYYYTPYQPDAAALSDLDGDGDRCSSFGNRNFWVIYNTWFGSPTAGSEPVVDRIAGADRYSTAVAIARSAFPDRAKVVYVASGANFPDALSAAPAAAHEGGPLLLTDPGSLPTVVSDTITALHPETIVLVGGGAVISDLVVRQLAAIQPKLVRLGGADRFDTSQQIIRHAFPSAGTAYLASGANFPDALSASAAAGSVAGPVMLVNGGQPQLDSATTQFLRELHVTRTVIAGGLVSISQGIQNGLQSAGFSVSRQAGDDRFLTSRALNHAAFGTASTVYLANGLNYPDALAGAAIAGGSGSPLYVVRPDCVPDFIAGDVFALGADRVHVLGGEAVTTANVEKLGACQ